MHNLIMNMHIWYSVVFNEFGTSKKIKRVRLCQSQIFYKRVVLYIFLCYATEWCQEYQLHMTLLLYQVGKQIFIFITLVPIVQEIITKYTVPTNLISLSSHAKQPIQIDAYFNLSAPTNPPATLLIIIFHSPAIDAVLISIVVKSHHAYFLDRPPSRIAHPHRCRDRITGQALQPSAIVASSVSLYNTTSISFHYHTGEN